MKILHIDSSMAGEHSISRAMSSLIVQQLLTAHQQDENQVIYHDLYAHPPSFLSAVAMKAVRSANLEGLSDKEQADVRAIHQAIDELFACDVLVIGVPMYNHTIPAVLHAWIDQICQAGKTFRYTETGPEGLVANKPIYIASSRGGIYSTAETLQYDQQEVFMKSILSLLGLQDIQIFRAEGIGLVEQREQRLLAVQQQIQAFSWGRNHQVQATSVPFMAE
ncbi:FMN-dependent NADH-azoreductase [Celerinatantimonas yamalensis]|uniref:FMN dependent NADH:quinone oxidoreductase n=1 Tax=Celerinatantimonas yamalensis TaxID=559956 RepID=A0ABW9GAW8_9GAMM